MAASNRRNRPASPNHGTGSAKRRVCVAKPARTNISDLAERTRALEMRFAEIETALAEWTTACEQDAERIGRIRDLEQQLAAKYPTVAAYEAVCAAYNKRVKRCETLDAEIKGHLQFATAVREVLGIGPAIDPLACIRQLQISEANARAVTAADKLALEDALRSDAELRQQIQRLKHGTPAELFASSTADQDQRCAEVAARDTLRGSEIAGSPQLIPGTVSDGKPTDWTESDQ